MSRIKTRPNEATPLARFVTERLAEIEMRQSEFCRLNKFDQGMLSKIQHSINTNLSLESALRDRRLLGAFGHERICRLAELERIRGILTSRGRKRSW